MYFRIFSLCLFFRWPSHPGCRGISGEHALRFEVTVAEGLCRPRRTAGCLWCWVARTPGTAPRHRRTGLKAPPSWAATCTASPRAARPSIDQSAILFPLEHLADLPRGDYAVQAVFDVNRDLN